MTYTALRLYETRTGKTFFTADQILDEMAYSFEAGSNGESWCFGKWIQLDDTGRADYEDRAECKAAASEILGKDIDTLRDGWRFYFSSKTEAQGTADKILAECREIGHEAARKKIEKLIDNRVKRLSREGLTDKAREEARDEITELQAELAELDAHYAACTEQ